jgi:predicted nuclease with TOPRIM domain
MADVLRIQFYRSLQSQLRDVSRILDYAADEIDRLEAENKTIEEKNQKLLEEIEDLKESTKW